MKHSRTFSGSLLACLLTTSAALADDRLTLSANGSTLTDSDGGVGGAVGWLHNFSPDAVFGLAAEHQTIADARWTFGSISTSLTRGPSTARRSLYGDFHKGTGDDNSRDFNYQAGALGVFLPLAGRLSLQLEDRQIDIDTSHGNMPKVGLSMLWTPRLQTAVSYTDTAGGNLGTNLGAALLDYYGPVHWLVGGAVGRADPVVVNLQPGTQLRGRTLRQGFAGFSKAFSRTELLMIADYLELAGSERVTLTVGLTVNLRSARAPTP